MTSPETENPFVSPPSPSEAKTTPEEVMRYARVGWIMPILGVLGTGHWTLAAGLVLNLPYFAVTMLILAVSLFFGIRCTLIAMALRSHNPHVGPQIGWAIAGNLMMVVLLVACTIGLFNVDWSDFLNAIY